MRGKDFSRIAASIPSARKENAGGRIFALAANDVSVYAVSCRPNPVALVVAEVVQILYRRHAPPAAPLHLCSIVIRREDAILRNPALALQS